MSGCRVTTRVIVCFVGWCLLAAMLPQPAVAQMVEPVEGEVVDAFRPPAHFGGPGNRGWEYATAPGSPAVAGAPGVVVFAGRVGDGPYVSVDHGAGLGTTDSRLIRIEVAVGDRVDAGTSVGVTGSIFHFGARRDGDYVDPAILFGSTSGRVRLVPRPPGGSRPSLAQPVGGGVLVSTGQDYTLALARFRVS